MWEVAVTDTLRCGRVFYDMCGRAFYDTLPVAVAWEVEVAVAVAVAVGITCVHTAIASHT